MICTYWELTWTFVWVKKMQNSVGIGRMQGFEEKRKAKGKKREKCFSLLDEIEKHQNPIYKIG